MEEGCARKLLVPLLLSWVVSKKPVKLIIPNLANCLGATNQKEFYGCAWAWARSLSVTVRCSESRRAWLQRAGGYNARDG